MWVSKQSAGKTLKRSSKQAFWPKNADSAKFLAILCEYSAILSKFSAIFGRYFVITCRIFTLISVFWPNQPILAKMAEYSVSAKHYGRIFGFCRNWKTSFGRTLILCLWLMHETDSLFLWVCVKTRLKCRPYETRWRFHWAVGIWQADPAK